MRYCVFSTPKLKNSPDLHVHKKILSRDYDAEIHERHRKGDEIDMFFEPEASFFNGVALVGKHVMTHAARHLDGDMVSMASKYTGLVDTLKRMDDGRMFGTCATVIGIANAMNEKLRSTDEVALILGAGPMARAAILACKGLEISPFITDHSHNLVVRTARTYEVPHITWEQRHTARFNIIINTRTDGDAGGSRKNETPWPYPFDEDHLVVDTSYNIRNTGFMLDAYNADARLVPGSEVALARGVERHRIWLDIPASPEAMEAARADIEEKRTEDLAASRRRRQRVRMGHPSMRGTPNDMFDAVNLDGVSSRALDMIRFLS